MGEHEFLDSARMPGDKGQSDVPADGEADQSAARNLESVEQRQQFVAHVVDRPRPRGLRAAKSNEIGCDNTVTGGEVIDLRLPHRVVQRKGMHEEKDWTLSLFDVM